MTSVNESTFGSRFLHAQDIQNYLQNFAGYNPPDQLESAADFSALLQNIAASNSLYGQSEQQYKAAVKARSDAFKNKTGTSILKLLPQIRAAVDAKYGKKSQESAAAGSIIAKMRATKLKPAPAALPTSAAGTANAGAAATQKKAISMSQQSYGSLLGYFHNLINALSQMNGYAPSNPDLQVANLQTFADSLDTLNATVAQKSQLLQQQRKERLDLYTDMSARVQKIKSYVKSEYGMKSKEYQLIKGVQV